MPPSDTPSLPVLIIDDEQAALQSCERILRSGGIESVILCQDSREATRHFDDNEIGAVLLDLAMPHVSGQELLELMTESYPDVPVIVVTGFNEVETAVECTKLGAFDYMVKPVEKSRMVIGVKRALELRELHRDYDRLKNRLLYDTLEQPEAFRHIVTQNAAMRSIFQYIETIAKTTQPVLITGDTGVGKELVAQAVHALAGREGPFIDINVAGVDDHVFSDTLFGHTKGAYTGAEGNRDGLISQAAGGTLLLDEIGDLSAVSQVKLLRLLQERSYYRLGSDVARRADVRFVFTTNRDLAEPLRNGQFRKDLYYRLRTHHVHLPPLRERLDDLPLLVNHFLEKVASSLGKTTPTPPRELVTLLRTYSFPGNVRELEAMVFDAVSVHKTRMLSMDVFKAHIAGANPASPMSDLSEEGLTENVPPLQLGTTFPTLSEATQFLVQEALYRAEGNLTIASGLLGISRQALSKRMKRSEADSSSVEPAASRPKGRNSWPGAPPSLAG